MPVASIETNTIASAYCISHSLRNYSLFCLSKALLRRQPFVVPGSLHWNLCFYKFRTPSLLPSSLFFLLHPSSLFIHLPHTTLLLSYISCILAPALHSVNTYACSLARGISSHIACRRAFILLILATYCSPVSHPVKFEVELYRHTRPRRSTIHPHLLLLSPFYFSSSSNPYLYSSPLDPGLIHPYFLLLNYPETQQHSKIPHILIQTSSALLFGQFFSIGSSSTPPWSSTNARR